MSEKPSTADIISAWASVAQVVVLGIAAIFGYFLIDRKATDADVRLKQIQASSELTQNELDRLRQQRESTPIVNLGIEDTISHGIDGRFIPISVTATVKNDGLVTAHVGRIAIDVYEGAPPPDISELLIRSAWTTYESREPGVPALPPDGREANEVQSDSNDVTPAAPSEDAPADPWERGRLYPFGASSVAWTRNEELSEEVEKHFTLQPGQSRSFIFSFVVEQPDSPKWVKLEIGVRAQTSGEWETQQYQRILRLGPLPRVFPLSAPAGGTYEAAPAPDALPPEDL